VDLGSVVVRPMHREHAFETALLLTEAFLVDRSPPAFPWMLCALVSTVMPSPLSC
jgi:hypothetical protein